MELFIFLLYFFIINWAYQIYIEHLFWMVIALIVETDIEVVVLVLVLVLV